MTMKIRIGAAVASLFGGLSMAVMSPATAQAQGPVCPEGTYWYAATAQCVPDEVDVDVDPAPIVGPAGPAGAGGVVGPVGPGPVGPGPLGR
jgi:hypothetical protein